MVQSYAQLAPTVDLVLSIFIVAYIYYYDTTTLG